MLYAGNRAVHDRAESATWRDSQKRLHGGIAGDRQQSWEHATTRMTRPVRCSGDRGKRQERAIYPNVNTLVTLSPHLATFLSQPWLCERVIKWFMHSLDVFGEIQSNLSEQIAVELLFPVWYGSLGHKMASVFKWQRPTVRVSRTGTETLRDSAPRDFLRRVITSPFNVVRVCKEPFAEKPACLAFAARKRIAKEASSINKRDIHEIWRAR